MDKKEFGAYIKSRREALGMTQKKLGGLVGEEPVYVYSIEAGRFELGSEKFIDWAKALQVEIKEFYNQAGVPYPFEEKPEHYIALPDHFPPETKTQLETFVKFIQYQKEFEQFLKLYHAAPVQFEGNVEDFVNNLISEELKKRDQAS